jgi:two-component system sensor histidine kinase HydH
MLAFISIAQVMWKSVLLPTALVTGIWLLTSASTTYYLVWLDTSYEHALARNVRSIQAADSLQNSVWRVLLDFPLEARDVERFRTRWLEESANIDQQVEILSHATGDDAEKDAVVELKSLIARLRDKAAAIDANSPESLDVERPSAKAGLRELGGEIATATQKFRYHNQQLLDVAADQRKSIQEFVFAGRALLLVAGPALGVWLGWRLSRRLHRSVSKLSVTLRDASTHMERPVASLELTPSRDLSDVQLQADHVVNRIREVSQELDSARQEVLQAERLAAVGGLAAGVAHELRNPLTSIKLLLQHAGRQSGAIPLHENKLRLILEEISKMEATIQGLLDFSRPPELSRVKHDLKLTVTRGLNLVDGRLRQQRIEVSRRIFDESLWVNGNVEQLHQLLVNLLINAIEAMPDGGALTIFAGYCDDGAKIRIEVADTGPGIPAEIMARMFEPFVTTKKRGTGLGLAISRRIVEAHGGSIRAANLPTGGALFVVELPAFVSESIHVGASETLCTAGALK